MKKYLMIIAATLALASCGGNQHKAEDPLADSGRTQRTENLLANLKQLGDSGVYLFGHEDATLYGVGWEGDENRSDVKSVCNDFPALVSFDLGGIEQGDSVNLDGVSFERIRQAAVKQYDQGGMVSVSWTVPEGITKAEQVSAVADFLNALETPYGVKVPILLRLRKGQTKEGWKLLVDQMREKEVTNVLYVYSVEADSTGIDEVRYMEQYPGDDIIDVMGLDNYCMAPDGDSTKIAAFAEQLDQNLAVVSAVAKKHQKVIALTETGYEGLKVKDWWTKTLAPVLAKHPVCYVMVWRNANNRPGYYFAPYPGQQSYSDFVRFYNDKRTLFLHDINGLYLQKSK
ncbi:MAG: beta-mannosidase [Prevotella sp.]|nr:beta-mannosidase [Prevotella sp.]